MTLEFTAKDFESLCDGHYETEGLEESIASIANRILREKLAGAKLVRRVVHLNDRDAGLWCDDDDLGKPVANVHHWLATVSGVKKCKYYYLSTIKEVSEIKAKLKCGEVLDLFRADHNFVGAWMK